MYEISCNVRFSETDRSGVMSMNGLLRLFQDVGYAHALERGFGLEFTKRTRCTWYLLSWQIEAFRMPAAGEHITLSINTCTVLVHKTVIFGMSEIKGCGVNCVWLFHYEIPPIISEQP